MTTLTNLEKDMLQALKNLLDGYQMVECLVIKQKISTEEDFNIMLTAYESYLEAEKLVRRVVNSL